MLPRYARLHDRKARRGTQRYQARFTHLTPMFLTVKDSGVLITGRLLVLARGKHVVEQEIWRGVLRAFADNPTSISLTRPSVPTSKALSGSVAKGDSRGAADARSWRRF